LSLAWIRAALTNAGFTSATIGVSSTAYDAHVVEADVTEETVVVHPAAQ